MLDFMIVYCDLGVEKITHTGTTESTTLFSYCSDYFYEGGNGASFPGLFGSMARDYMLTIKPMRKI